MNKSWPNVEYFSMNTNIKKYVLEFIVVPWRSLIIATNQGYVLCFKPICLVVEMESKKILLLPHIDTYKRSM
jgi:hypothetical protein